jgi:hypothetical protein
MLFSGEKGGVHMRNPRGAVAVLDEEGPGCAARLALKL